MSMSLASSTRESSSATECKLCLADPLQRLHKHIADGGEDPDATHLARRLCTCYFMAHCVRLQSTLNAEPSTAKLLG